jgi:hypothetical protein
MQSPPLPRYLVPPRIHYVINVNWKLEITACRWFVKVCHLIQNLRLEKTQETGLLLCSQHLDQVYKHSSRSSSRSSSSVNSRSSSGTSAIKVLPEKLTVPQLVKKFPAFYGSRMFIIAFTSASPIHSNPVHTPPPPPNPLLKDEF